MSGDRALHEAFAKDAARQAITMITRAAGRLEAAATMAGEHQFDSVLPELERVKQMIKDIAEGTKP
jgi:hypothetical protein